MSSETITRRFVSKTSASWESTKELLYTDVFFLKQLGSAALKITQEVVKDTAVGATAGLFLAGGLANNKAGMDVGPMHGNASIVAEPAAGIISDLATLRIQGASAPLGKNIPLGGYFNVDWTKSDATDSKKLAEEVGLVGDPQALAGVIEDNYIHNMEHWMLGGAIAGGAIEAAGIWAYRRKSKNNLEKSTRRFITILALGASGAIGAGLFAYPTYDYSHIKWQSATIDIGDKPINIGYSGAGAQTVKNYISANETYYNTTEHNVEKVFTPIAKKNAQEFPDEDATVIASDLHCNTGMIRDINTIAKITHAKTLFNLGDTVNGNSDIENICVDLYRKGVNDNIHIVSIAGNHDGNNTMEEEKKQGFTILDSTTTKVDGINVLGFTDPHLTEPGSTEDVLRDPSMTIDDFKKYTKEKACNGKEQSAILLNHEPDNGQMTDAIARCVHLMLNGHTHVQTGLKQVGLNSFRMTVGTAGGAAPDKKSWGYPLGKEASINVLYTNRITHLPTAIQTVTIYPDKSVEVSNRILIPNNVEPTNETTALPSTLFPPQHGPSPEPNDVLLVK